MDKIHRQACCVPTINCEIDWEPARFFFAQTGQLTRNYVFTAAKDVPKAILQSMNDPDYKYFEC